MSKVLHVRDVPDDVHEALTAAAAAEGVSLTRYVRRELGRVARRAEVVRTNVDAARRTQAAVRGGVDRATVLAVLHEGRRG